jgi:hypothetical protein
MGALYGLAQVFFTLLKLQIKPRSKIVCDVYIMNSLVYVYGCTSLLASVPTQRKLMNVFSPLLRVVVMISSRWCGEEEEEAP